MVSLHQLAPPPGHGEVTACECEGVLRSLPPAAAAALALDMLGGGAVVVRAECSESVRPVLGKQDAQHAFSGHPRLPTSLALAYRERGLLGCLQQAADGCGGDSGGVRAVAAAWLLAGIRTLQAVVASLRGLQPHLTTSTATRAQLATTGGSGGSAVVCICWHGVSRRLAVAYSDDSVRVLSPAGVQQPVLKHRTQRNITALCWLPFNMGVVGVACDAGVLLWSVEPSSVVTRPSGACITLLPAPRHHPYTPCLAAHPQGEFVSVSGGVGVTVWDVGLVTGVKVQQTGVVTHMHYSPDGAHLLVVLHDPPMLRVFNTTDWSLVEWICPGSAGAVRCCVWSPCSAYVLFCTAEPLPAVYAIAVAAGTATTQRLLDLTHIQLTDAAGDTVSVGGAVRALAWGGERLLVVFEDSPYLALFHTLSQHTLQLAPGGLMKGPDGCVAVSAAFHPAQPSLLTVVWSDNSLQHIPLAYTSRQTAALNATLNMTAVHGAALNLTALHGATFNITAPHNASLNMTASYGASLDITTGPTVPTPGAFNTPQGQDGTTPLHYRSLLSRTLDASETFASPAGAAFRATTQLFTSPQ